jgi:dihydropteroate synthase-like protein
LHRCVTFYIALWYKKLSETHKKQIPTPYTNQQLRRTTLKTLLITGILAENTVKEYTQQSRRPTQVLALNTAVAALLSPQTILNALQKISLKDVEVILVPGQILGDTKIIAEATNIPTFKGPRYAADLPVVLDCLGEVELSTLVPACDLLREKLAVKALEELKKVELNRGALLKKPGSMLIGDVAVGKEFPMRVLAEIVDAPLLATVEIQRLARLYVRSGADILDVGMVAGESLPEDAKRAVETVKTVVDVPVSIDTFNPVEIKAAVEAGVDLILSGDEGNLKAIASFAHDVPLVVIPTNQRQGMFPQTPVARVRLLERLIKKAKQLGFTKIVGDLILEPTNVLQSYMAFHEFSDRNPDVPLLIGVANVVEMFDADSVGLNALLVRLASEVNVSILLVTEKSPKTRGSVSEASAAAKMMFLAKKRNSVPSDLGIDLLVLKEKTEIEAPFTSDLVSDLEALPVKNYPAPMVVDPCGVFRVMVNRDACEIMALHYQGSDATKPIHLVRGENADSVIGEVLRLGLVSRLDHAAYLGRELAKAEVALRTGRSYVQDTELFGRK